MANLEVGQEMGQIVPRVTLHIFPEAYKRLNEMRNITEVRANNDVIKNSLRFYNWFVDQQIQGNVVQVEPDKEKTFKRIDPKAKGVHLIRLDFSPSAWMTFNELRKKSEATDNQGLILDALNTCSQFLKERLPGNKIKVTEKGGTIKEVTFSFL